MSVRILIGDVHEQLALLPDESVHCVVTSPPYWGLRDYGVAGQIGIETDFRDYIATMVAVFHEVRRALRHDGTLWLNLGDSYAPENRGENAKPRSDPSYGRFMQGEHMHADLPTRRECITAVKAAGVKRKDLIGMPWRVAFALQDDGWWLRQDIIWSKPNPMPESVTDRCTKAHEYLFLLSKSERYHYDADAIKEASITDDPRRPYGSEGAWSIDGRPAEQRHGGEPRTAGRASGSVYTAQAYHHPQSEPRGPKSNFGEFSRRNKRSVWTVATAPYSEAHFATFPPALIEPCILAGCPVGGTILDPFFGAGTTGLVSDRLQRNCIGIELNPAYAEMARKRIERDAGLFAEVA